MSGETKVTKIGKNKWRAFDPATKDGDFSCELVMKKNKDGSVTVLSVLLAKPK
jgi:hypothetical protein